MGGGMGNSMGGSGSCCCYTPGGAGSRAVPWQEMLVGWTVEARQYTTGIPVRGHVQARQTDRSANAFRIRFENNSVEYAELPHEAIKLLNARGGLTSWGDFLAVCTARGAHVDASLRSVYKLPSPSSASERIPALPAWRTVPKYICSNRLAS